MSAPAKFLFETDFSAGNRPANSVSLTEHRAKVSEAEARGYRTGFAAAQAEAAADMTRRLGIALEAAAKSLGAIAQGLDAVESKLEAEAIDVALAVARKLAPELIAREPLAETAALVTNCLRELCAAPHVAVRVNDAIYPSAKEKLETIARQVGFEGRLLVLGEPDIREDDCRIEWADGGVARERLAAEAAVADAVTRYLAVRQKASHAQNEHAVTKGIEP